MESFTDYYAILGVAQDASAEEIKNAFRAEAIKFHPDHNKSPDATTRFIELQKAFNVLNDPEDRKTYDIIYELHMQEAARPPLSRHWMESASVVLPKPERDPIYITMNFKRGHSARFFLENIPYSLTSDQVNVLMHDGMIRVHSSDMHEYLFMFCIHCHALFTSKCNRDKIGLLYFPYDLFPLCPHCDAPNWCPANDIREKRKKEAEVRREQVARERLKRWREQHCLQLAVEVELQVTKMEINRREAERRKGAMQRKTREQHRMINRCAIGIASILILVLLGAILFLASVQSPTITDLQLANPGFVARSSIEIGFNYQPGNTPGFIEAQFYNESGVVDTQKLDTKDVKAGSQTVSSRVLPGIYAGGGTVSLSWCPYYDCSRAQPLGSLDFTLGS
jgi:hypothetical protein